MARKQVLILGHNYATQFIDIYNEYARLFDKDKYEVTIAYLTGEPSDEVRNRTYADNILFLDIPNRSLRTLKINAIRKLLALSRKNKYDIAICHRYKPTYIMMWVAQFYRFRALVCVMHELKTMSSIGRKFIMATLRRKNMLFAGVSNAVRDDIRKSLWFVPTDRIVTLYNMLDVDLIEPQLLDRNKSRAVLNLDKNAFVFGNIARLAPNKDQKTLIDAFALIKPYCQNIKLIIIGDGSLEKTLKAYAIKKDVSEDVIFTGFLSGGFRYMKAFDCFALPSKQEAFGRVLIEAMLARIPIIASRANGIPEVVDNVGTLIQAGNVNELANAMKKIWLASDAERKLAGDNGYQRVINYFSIPQFHKQFWQQPLLQSIKE